MRIWLTGGSGSGKSAAARAFRAAGYVVADADRIAHEVTAKGTECARAVRAAFPEAASADGTVDRRALAEIVFGNAEKLAILNGITHPYIIKEIERQCAGTENAVIDAPLPNTFGVLCDRTCVISADRETRIKRICARDRITPGEAEKRLASQISEEEYKAMADAVIENNETEAALFEKLAPYIKDWFSE